MNRAGLVFRSDSRIVIRWMAPVVCMLSISLVSCETPSRTETIRCIGETTPPAAHAVHSERLLAIMRSMNSLSLGRLPQEMSATAGDRQRVAKIAETASRLAASSDAIAGEADTLQLTDAQRTSFLRLANILKEEAAELSRIAQEGANIRLVRFKLDEMTTTCNACHRLFRDRPAKLPD